MDIGRMVQSIWPDWEIVERIGEGSFGSVFRARRRDIVGVAEAAIKVASIPQSSDELESLQMEGLTPEQSRTYLESVVQDLTTEIRMMERVKGYTNIVTIEDYKVVKHKDKLLWNIFIRMELLKPLNRVVAERPMTEDEVIRLGEDLCSALVVCRKKRIVHRDIKPENIFVNEDGDYKLGDFGVARSLERLTTVLTRKGTYNYMAPEVFNQTVSDTDIVTAARVDICSLGLVLYQLMNKGRLPFIPDKQLPTPTDRQNAIVRRMKGEPIPPPSQASEALSQVILKACSFKSEDRFETAEDMRDALRRVAAGEPLNLSGPEAPAPEPTPVPPTPKAPQSAGSGMDLEDIEDGMSPAPDPEKTLPPREHIHDSGRDYVAGDVSTQEARNASPAPRPPKRRSPVVPILAAVLILALLGGAGWFVLRPRGDEGQVLAQASPGAETAAPTETAAPAETSGAAEVSGTPEATATAEAATPTASVEAAASAVSSETAAPGFIIETISPKASAGTAAPAAAADASDAPDASATEEAPATPNPSAEATSDGASPSAEATADGAGSSAEATASPDPAPDLPVSFASDAIEEAARNALGKAEGDLTAGELAGIRELDLSNRGLSDISDLKAMTGLTELDLSGNNIADVTPLAGLTGLKTLYVDGNPRLTDVSSLAGLTALTAYYGPMPAWPEGAARIVACLREEDASDAFDAVARAFLDTGHWAQVSLGSAATDDSNSLAFASSLCSGGIKDVDGAVVSADAILLFPQEGVEYAGACARALIHGIPMYTFKGRTQSDIYDEVCALYGNTGDGNPFR